MYGRVLLFYYLKFSKQITMSQPKCISVKVNLTYKVNHLLADPEFKSQGRTIFSQMAWYKHWSIQVFSLMILVKILTRIIEISVLLLFTFFITFIQVLKNDFIQILIYDLMWTGGIRTCAAIKTRWAVSRRPLPLGHSAAWYNSWKIVVRFGRKTDFYLES